MKINEVLLTERFVNAFINDMDIRDEYRDRVWELLQKAYAPIGGLAGMDDSSALDALPMWKLIVNKGVLHGVVLYKDTNGRKSVAIATDGSHYGKRKLVDVLKNDINRSYSEVSKGALGLRMKSFPWDILKNFVIPPDEAGRILDKEVIPVKSLDKLPADAISTLERFPELIPYGYIRNIGGKPFFKVMIGSPFNFIE